MSCATCGCRKKRSPKASQTERPSSETIARAMRVSAESGIAFVAPSLQQLTISPIRALHEGGDTLELLGKIEQLIVARGEEGKLLAPGGLDSLEDSGATVRGFELEEVAQAATVDVVAAGGARRQRLLPRVHQRAM